MGCVSMGVLLLVDVMLCVHSVVTFCLELLCRARLYIRRHIRDVASHPSASCHPAKYSCSDPAQHTSVYYLVHKFFLYYSRFAVLLLFAFSKALCVFLMFLLHQLCLSSVKYCRRLRYQLTASNCGNWQHVRLIEEAVGQLTALIPADKKPPNHVVIIVPEARCRVDDGAVKVLMGMTAFYKQLSVNHISLFFPLLETAVAAHLGGEWRRDKPDVSVVCSVSECERCMLEAMGAAREAAGEQCVTRESVTENMTYPHADQIVVLGGAPCLYGYIPWNTRLSEIFFLPPVHKVTPADLLAATRRYFCIEQRFGK